ncbi:WD40 repeat-like protein [Imleria badia]|nr:WD40 repeat-like protein [Imleria badia]
MRHQTLRCIVSTTKQFAVGTPTQANKSDNRGQVTPSDWIHSLSLSPDGSILAGGSDDKTVRFWDVTSGQPVGQYLRHDEGVTAVCFSPSSESVASVGYCGKIYFWLVPWLNSIESRVKMLIIFARVKTTLLLVYGSQVQMSIFLWKHHRYLIFESRLRQLVLIYIYCRRRIIKQFLTGRSRDFKGASRSASSLFL